MGQGEINELALFAGAGGGLLAGKLLGIRPICAVENNWYSRCVLVARQNDGSLDPFPIWDDIHTFSGQHWRGNIDLITGGFPCQAFSTASRGRRVARDLWGEMLRVIRDVSPPFVFAENVSRKAIDKAADDLETMGYKTRAVSLSAKDMGSDHARRRYWLFAHADNKGELLRGLNAEMAELPELQSSVWESFAGESRVPNGMASRVERFKAIGNGQVPIVAATAFRILVDSFFDA